MIVIVLMIFPVGADFSKDHEHDHDHEQDEVRWVQRM
jgi:hypothetical protein